MADPPPGSDGAGDQSQNTAEAYHSVQMQEYRSIKMSMKLVRPGDDLDKAVLMAVESMMTEPPTLEGNDYNMSYVLDLIHGLPQVEDILVPEFYRRITLPFRLLRRVLDLHLVNPIKEGSISELDLSDDDREDPRLFEHVWFLLFVGASPHGVVKVLHRFRENRTTLSSPSVPREGSDIFQHMRPRSQTQPQMHQDARTPAQTIETMAHIPLPVPSNSANAHSRDNAQAFNAQENQPSNALTFRENTHAISHGRTNGPDDLSYQQSKKAFAVQSYFKDRKFEGRPDQSINNLIRDYEICADQQCLDRPQMSLFFVNALADPARDFFLTSCSPRMPFDEIVAKMQRHYNSETRKLQLQSEMDSLDLSTFMRKNQISDYSDGLIKLTDYINAMAPQLPLGFGNDAHKTRYLRRAVMRHEWAKQPISLVTTARYTFTQFITALQESLQLSDELSRAQAPEVNYGQYVRDPRDVRYPNNPQMRRNTGWTPRRDYSNRSRSPANRFSTNRSQSPYNSRNRYNQGGRFNNRQNPNIPRKRFCYGCGSPDHILSDGKCTPTLNQIKTNLVQHLESDPDATSELAEQFLTLHASPSARPDSEKVAPGRNNNNAPGRRSDDSQQVHFEETLYSAEERDILQSHVEASFQGKPFSTQFVSNDPNPRRVFDCSHIHLSNHHPLTPNPGFCVDIGAPRSVIGKSQIDLILKHHGKKNIARFASPNSFRFGDVTAPSIGMIELFLNVPAPRRSIAVLMDIVEVDVPALLGLDVLDAEQLYACNVTNRLVHREVQSRPGEALKYEDKWSVPLIRHADHLYAEMCFPASTFYTSTQLQRFHRQFAHPSAGKLYNLLKKAGLEAVDANTLQQLEDIVAKCEPCQRIRNAPLRFRVSMGHEGVRFNSRAYIDIMYLDGRPVLHIVDESTRFSAARFLPKVSTDAVWEAIVMCWSSVYTGLPQYIMVDEGTQFRKVFAELSALHEIELEKSGVQSHNSLGVGERYHKPLRDTYRKLKLDHPSMQRQLLLALAIKAMNDTLGPEGFVPSALVFGEFPSLRTFAGPVLPRPSLAERAEAAQEARRYMAKHLAQIRVKGALHHNTPSATNRTYQPGDKVLIWREKLVENRIGEWVGPYTVNSFEESSKIVLVQKNADSPHERYHITQVKPFIEPEAISQNFIRTVHSALVNFSSNSRLVADCQTRPVAVHATEIIEYTDPRAHGPEMSEAIRDEVQDLIRRGTFKIILKDDLPSGANALTARFVLGIKTDAEGAVKYKARYVMGGHRDHMKQYLVHGAQTLQPSSARLLIALASAYDFEVWSSDVKLAYLQSTEPFLRRVYIKNPAPEFQLAPDQCLELLRPLYGLSDAGDLWHRSLDKHLTSDLGLIPTKTDPSLYFSFRDKSLVGINGTYVDDLLRSGTKKFRKECDATHRRFETSGDESLPFTFAGFHVTQPPNVPYAIDQTFYIKQLEELEMDSSFREFRSMRMKLAWLANTRPDLQFEISQLAQVTQERYDDGAKAHLTRLNSAIRYAHNNVAHLQFPKLEMSSLRIVGYSDAAFANNYDLSSQLGRIILLQDSSNSAIPLIFKSYKSRRVTRSVLSAEVIAFADLFDDAYALRAQLEQATSRAVPMHLLTDSKSLFDIISKGSRTSEKRVMLDIHAARQAYQHEEISNIGFVRSEDNIADGLTKPKMQAALLKLLLTGMNEVKCEQWILRHPRTGAPHDTRLGAPHKNRPGVEQNRTNQEHSKTKARAQANEIEQA